MRIRVVCGLAVALFAIGCHNQPPAAAVRVPASGPTTSRSAASVAHAIKPLEHYHLHLPGIGGYRNIDRRLLVGLEDGGVRGEISHYDWTTADPGLGSLLARKRNNEEATNVAQIILEHYRANPSGHITLSAHSGGAGILTWALEQLPADVMVDSVVLMAPALSPSYDLSKALHHVRGHMYVFSSEHDVAVLGIGTSMFGTIDGVKTEAAGKVGFKMPTTAESAQYEKLVQMPYDRDWSKYDNWGEHIGTMSREFGREVIAPLLVGEKAVTVPTTQAAR